MINDNPQLLRQAFHDYLTAPYANNPTSKRGMQAWFDDLFSRPDKDQIELRFVQARSAVTGEVIDAFCLNRQMFFSHSAGVMTLPHPHEPVPVSSTFVSPNERVGIWLHDMGNHRRLERQTQPILDGMKSDDKNFLMQPQPGGALHFVHRQIAAAFKPYLRDLASELGQGQSRVAKMNIRANNGHMDELRAKTSAEEGWTRVVIYPYMRSGTNYFLPVDGINKDYEGFKVLSPTHAVNVHMATKILERNSRHTDQSGAYHQPQTNPDGRAILIYSDEDPARVFRPFGDTSPNWQIEGQTAAASAKYVLPVREPRGSFASLVEHLRQRTFG